MGLDAEFLKAFITQIVISATGGGIGAWVGAGFAFRLERQKSREARDLAASTTAAVQRETKAAAGNLAIFTLSQIFNDLATYDQQFIAPTKVTDAPWFWLPATDVSPSSYHIFDIPSLAFLLKSPDPEMLMRLHLEADRYHALLNTMQLRSTCHQTHAIPVIEILCASKPAGAKFSEVELISAFGNREYQTLKNYASDIFSLTELGLETSKATGDRLRKLLTAMFPEEKFIGFEADISRITSPIMQARNDANR